MKFWYLGIPTAARIPMIRTTIISSISVKPLFFIKEPSFLIRASKSK
jgi:hypothetical protein